MTRNSIHPPGGNITPGHVRAFQAVTSQLYDNVTLWSCRINGEPGVAIVMIDQVAADKIAVMPLFVALTESMVIDFEGEAGGEEGGGGPARPDEVAATIAEVTMPR